MLKTSVSSARNVGMSLKKRRFLKLIPIFVGIKNIYHSDYQHLSRNAKKQAFFVNERQLACKYRLYACLEQVFC